MEQSRQPPIVGLDVSKAWLDGYLPGAGRPLRVSNDAAGIEELLQSLADPGGCLVVMEASGGYERTAHRELVARGVLAAIVNPKRVRDFARGMGLEAKTDRVDARLIARYGAVMRPAATPVPDPARLELREILACRRQLVDEIAVRKQQLEHLRSPLVRAAGRTGAGLPAAGGQGAAHAPARADRGRSGTGRRLRAADLHARLRPDPGRHPAGRNARARHPRPPPGRGPRRPRPRRQGQRPAREPPRHQGRPRPGPPRPLHGRRRQPQDRQEPAQRPATPSWSPRGKPPKLALTALMRTMLVTLNAMLKAKSAWQDPRQT